MIAHAQHPCMAQRLAARTVGNQPVAARSAVNGLHQQPVLRLTPVAGLRQRQAIRQSQRHAAHVVCQAASASADGALPSKSVETKSAASNTLLLGTLFGGWYLFNIWFNIYNKQVLKTFPYPITCTTIQFAVGALLALFMWASGLHKRPQINGDTVKAIIPLAVVHTLGNLLTNVSLGRVAVSFTHTIKAMEPFFSVLLSSLFLGDRPTLPIVLSLFPVVGGVALASVSEATFNWGGFLSAMGSNVTFQSRNVFSKKFMGGSKASLDNINLFSIITLMSFLLLAPVTLATEGVRFTPGAMEAMGITNAGEVIKKAIMTGFFFHSYQQVSYMILQRVSPVTHSIGNCLKRVIVIVASVIVFQNPMSQQNMIGTAIALAGVFTYSQVKRAASKKKVATA